MKQPKAPKLAQKRIMSGNNLNWKNWMVQEETLDELTVVNKISGKTRKLKKGNSNAREKK